MADRMAVRMANGMVDLRVSLSVEYSVEAWASTKDALKGERQDARLVERLVALKADGSVDQKAGIDKVEALAGGKVTPTVG